jgi:hypothetical protein
LEVPFTVDNVVPSNSEGDSLTRMYYYFFFDIEIKWNFASANW